jgi:hypothetical protein
MVFNLNIFTFISSNHRLTYNHLSHRKSLAVPQTSRRRHRQTAIMCLVFTCGETTFRKQVEGYEGVVCRCHNCGNYSATVVRSKPWFTFCFVVCTLLFPFQSKGVYTDITSL